MSLFIFKFNIFKRFIYFFHQGKERFMLSHAGQGPQPQQRVYVCGCPSSSRSMLEVAAAGQVYMCVGPG